MFYRILPVADGDAEADRLSRHGLAVHRLPESEIRSAAQPLVARGGDPQAGSFIVEPERSPMRGRRGLSPSLVQDAELYHLHTRERLRPIEIDPWAFRFDDGPGRVESSQLRMRNALEALVGEAPVDRSFRFEPPALAPSAGAGDAGREGVESLLRGSQPGGRKDRAATLLDNVAQFRFHSAWLAVLARRAG
jgi:hypothetical protein